MGRFQHSGGRSFAGSWVRPTCVPTQVDILPVLDHGPPPPPPFGTPVCGRSYTTEPLLFFNPDNGARRAVPLGFELPSCPPCGGPIRDSDPFVNGHSQDWEEMCVDEDGDGCMDEVDDEELATKKDGAETETMMGGQQVPGLEKPFEDLDGSEVEMGDDGTNMSLRKTVKMLRGEVEELKKKMIRERLECQRLGSIVEEMMEYLKREEHTHWGHRSEQRANFYHRHHHFGMRPGEAGRRDTGQSHRPSTYKAPPRPSKSIDDYNNAWKSVSDSKDAPGARVVIPWPTSSLQASPLSQHPQSQSGFLRPSHLPKEIRENIFQLRKWNAFSFFVQAFGLYPLYMQIDGAGGQIEGPEEPREAILFDIRVQGASRERLAALKAQLVQEKLRWHPDRLKRLSIGFRGEEEETAKAVLSAVLASSQACNRCLNLLG
ncbi:hypothetical protein MferCBS31731_007269 [Microsporum ferrugineum]